LWLGDFYYNRQLKKIGKENVECFLYIFH